MQILYLNFDFFPGFSWVVGNCDCQLVCSDLETDKREREGWSFWSWFSYVVIFFNNLDFSASTSSLRCLDLSSDTERFEVFVLSSVNPNSFLETVRSSSTIIQLLILAQRIFDPCRNMSYFFPIFPLIKSSDQEPLNNHPKILYLAQYCQPIPIFSRKYFQRPDPATKNPSPFQLLTAIQQRTGQQVTILHLCNYICLICTRV